MDLRGTLPAYQRISTAIRIMSMDEKLLGFDMRKKYLAPDRTWDPVRRRTFLLREDVYKPLSTDTLVWPSIFDTGQGSSLPAEERERLHLNGVPAPKWVGPNTGTWDDLDRMRRTFSSFTAKNPAANLPHTMLAITGFAPGGSHAGAVRIASNTQ